MTTTTDIGDLEVGVTKGDGLEVVLLITAIEDRIVPETVDLLEDLVVAEAIRTMIGSNTAIDLFQDLSPIQDHDPSHSPRKK